MRRSKIAMMVVCLAVLALSSSGYTSGCGGLGEQIVGPAATPRLKLSTTSIEITLARTDGNPAPMPVQIAAERPRDDVANLSAEAVTDPAVSRWLKPDLLRTTTPSTVLIGVFQDNLAPGTYDGQIILQVSGRPAGTVDVRLIVRPPVPKAAGA